MDILDRLLAHDAWTTRQLLLRCRELSDEQFDRSFDIGDRSLRGTFDHLIGCMERQTDFMIGRSSDNAPALREKTSIDDLLHRHTVVAKEFADVATRVQRDGTADRIATNRSNGRRRTLGSLAAHLITHSMHHRAQILYMMEKSGLQDVIEGDALSWESTARGWGWEDGDSYGKPIGG